MKKILSLALSLLAVIIFTSCNQTQDPPKYIFFFIGDGMGLGQEQLTESYLGAYDTENMDPKLFFTGMPQKGFITTYSKSHKITDSAAAGTALAAGEKTDNGRIMKNSDASESFKSVAHIAKENGMKVGILSSVSLDHATPAVFYANADSRNMYYEISMQLPDSEFDFFGGGGYRNPEGLESNNKYSEKYTQQDQEGTKATDKKNMLEYAREKGYTIINSKDALMSLDNSDEKIIAINPVLQSGSAMPYAIDNNAGDPELADYVEKAIEVLDNENGFFMMVEGGKIDWACHSNDAATVVHEIVDFDKAIGKAMEFFLQHPEETLIIVTGDHETGGLGMGNTLAGKETDYKSLAHQKASLEVIEKEMKSLQQPSYETIMTRVEEYFGLGSAVTINAYDSLRLKRAWKASFDPTYTRTDDDVVRYGYYEPVTITATHILSEKAGIAWTTFSHTAMPLPVHSIGNGSEIFGGYYDNTDIPKKIASLIGMP